jgi:hypothetical protein
MKVSTNSKKNAERQLYSYLASRLFKFFIKLYIFPCFLFFASSALAVETQIISTNVTHPNFQLTLQPDSQATTVYFLAGTTPGGSDLAVQPIFPSSGLSVFGIDTISVNVTIPANVDTVHVTLLTIGGNSPQINQPFPTAINQTDGSLLAISSPVDGSLLADKRSIIAWDWLGGTGSSSFKISVGTSVGAGDILIQYFNSTVREAPIDIELNGSQVYLKIETSTGVPDSDAGVTNYSVSASYQTATSGVDSGTRITAPSNASTIDTYTQRFEWVADPLAVTLDIETRSFNGGVIERRTLVAPSLGFIDLQTELHGDPITMTVKTYWASGAYYTRSYTFQTILGDHDNDGVGDKLDQCPDTPTSQFVKDNGCIDTRITSPLSTTVLDTYTVRFDWDPDPRATSLDFEMLGSAGNLIENRNSVLPSVGYVELQTELHGQPLTLNAKTYWNDGSDYTLSYTYQTVLGDGDSDGVDDTLDQCPNTPVSMAVSGNGCGDSDGDGIPDLDDPYPHQNATQCTP